MAEPEKRESPAGEPPLPIPLVGPLLGLLPRLAPLLVLAALVGIPVGVLAYQQLHLQGAGVLTPADGVRIIRIEAYQWGFEPANVTVKKGERVRILATSRDVTHGLQIQGYDIDMEARPGKWTAAEFTADKPGAFTMRCSVFCSATPQGSGMAHSMPVSHSEMMARHFQMFGKLIVEA